jgi:hypothetical protein
MGVCISKKKLDKFNARNEYMYKIKEQLDIKEIDLQMRENNLIQFNQKLQDIEEKLNILINKILLKNIKTLRTSKEFDV